MITIDIATDKPYKAYIGNGMIEQACRDVATAYPTAKFLIITDNNVAKLHLSKLTSSMSCNVDVYIVESGESAKSMDNYAAILSYLAENFYTRSDIIIALGGGVVGDLAGFVAASYMRGIRFIQLPTTLLAAIDSSVGGKTAINLPAGKNIVGAFHQPIACYVDIDTLATLSEAEWNCGMGEAVKYAILEGGSSLQIVANQVDMTNVAELIALSIQAKAKYVVGDELDKCKRMLLNLGHTYGHAIEAESCYSISHGRAVAMGILCALDLSIKLGVFRGSRVAIESLVHKLIEDYTISYVELNKWIARDKKAEGSMINLVLIEDIGSCILHKMSIRELLEIAK